MSEQTLTLSIIIPVYNEESHLRNCLDSIAIQSVPPDEVIIVDNNSTDGSVKLAKSYPFVTVVSEKRQGVTFARNKGFSTAKGKIIGRIDAESILTVNWVKHARDLFDDTEVMAVTGPLWYYDMPFTTENYIAEHVFKAALYKYDKKFPFLNGNNMAIRRTAWDKVKKEVCNDQDIHEDMDLAVHLSLHNYKVVYDVQLKAGSSARRFDDNPIDFTRYNTMMTRTFTKHNMKPIGARVAVSAYSLGYVVLWPLRRAFDPATGKRGN